MSVHEKDKELHRRIIKRISGINIKILLSSCMESFFYGNLQTNTDTVASKKLPCDSNAMAR